MAAPTLILASRSPRRRELLAAAGYHFEVLPADESVECGVCSERGPAGLVAELAYRKAAAIRTQLFSNPQSTDPNPQPVIILAADTVAECDGMILGKPTGEDHARAMLRQLRGRAHRVLTGVCVWPLKGPNPHLASSATPNLPPSIAEPLVRVAVTELRMDQLSDAAVEAYLATGQWEGKAGAFGYQDRLGWVHVESGSETNVVGLPMDLVAEMLAEVGLAARE
jgi:septum formation protein